MSEEIKYAHGNDPWAMRWAEKEPFKWRDDGTCSYCGSLKVTDAIALLKIEGTRYSGSDWKYGFPHKFYIGNKEVNPAAIKFYTRHLLDATPEEVAAFSEVSAELFGVRWTWEADGKVQFVAEYPGVQKWGIVGKATCRVCGCVGGERVGYCFCRAVPPCHPDPEIPDEKPSPEEPGAASA